MSEQKFKQIVDAKKAIEYLKSVGEYDNVKNANEKVFGNNRPINDDFAMVIAANSVYEKMEPK